MSDYDEITLRSGTKITLKSGESRTDFMDRAQKAYVKENREWFENLGRLLLATDAAAWRMSYSGVGRHAVAWDSGLPRSLREWVIEGCPRE